MYRTHKACQGRITFSLGGDYCTNCRRVVELQDIVDTIPFPDCVVKVEYKKVNEPEIARAILELLR